MSNIRITIEVDNEQTVEVDVSTDKESRGIYLLYNGTKYQVKGDQAAHGVAMSAVALLGILRDVPKKPVKIDPDQEVPDYFPF